MIRYIRGDILYLTNMEAIVNPVNCVGVMGKGLAAQFKIKYPDNFTAYQIACKNKEVKLGKMFVTETNLDFPKYIVNFPTKLHWGEDSVLSDIESGLISLSQWVRDNGVKSIALPRLGCGLGNLNWEDVNALMLKHMTLSKVDVVVIS